MFSTIYPFSSKTWRNILTLLRRLRAPLLTQLKAQIDKLHWRASCAYHIPTARLLHSQPWLTRRSAEIWVSGACYEQKRLLLGHNFSLFCGSFFFLSLATLSSFAQRFYPCSHILLHSDHRRTSATVPWFCELFLGQWWAWFPFVVRDALVVGPRLISFGRSFSLPWHQLDDNNVFLVLLFLRLATQER